MNNTIAIEGNEFPVPDDAEAPCKTTGRKGLASGLPLNQFIFSLLVENERRHHEWLVGREADKPYSDYQLEQVVIKEFAEYQSVLEAFGSGNYSVPQFRSRYRKGKLVTGAGLPYASFSYLKGRPCLAVGGHRKPIGYAKQLEEMKRQCPTDPRIPLLEKSLAGESPSSPPAGSTTRKSLKKPNR